MFNWIETYRSPAGGLSNSLFDESGSTTLTKVTAIWAPDPPLMSIVSPTPALPAELGAAAAGAAGGGGGGGVLGGGPAGDCDEFRAGVVDTSADLQPATTTTVGT